MAGRRNRRKIHLETLARREIQEAVVRILARHGADALTMERVAAEAGLGKATLYAYFKDKKQMIQSVKDANLDPLHEEILAILEAPAPPREKLERALARHLEFFDEHRSLFRVLLWDRQIVGQTARRHESTRYRRYVESVARVLAEGARAGAFRALDPEKVAPIVVEATVAVNRQRLRKESPEPVEQDARMLLDVVLNGIAVGG